MRADRQPSRITRVRSSGTARRSQPGSYRAAWSNSALEPREYLTPPAYSQLSDAPKEFVERAAAEKLVWIKRFADEGYPRGQLLPFAQAYAAAAGIPAERVPPYSTLNTWAKRYRQFGLLGLVDKVRSDAGTSRVLAPDAQTLLEAFLIATGGNYQAATDLLARHGDQTDEPALYGAVRRAARVLETQDPHLYALARHGEVWFRQHLQLALAQGFLPGGFRLSLDSTVADLWARLYDASLPEKWRAVRPVLTVVECVGSRLCVTFNLSLHQINSGTILGTFGRAVSQSRNYPGLVSTGLPHELAVDKGAEHQGVFRDRMKTLQVKVLPSGPNDPRKRARVERLIGTLQTELLPNLPGYSPLQQVVDPYAPAESDMKRRIAQLRYQPYRSDVPLSSLLTLEELETRILAWATVYNQRPHVGLPAESPDLQRLVAARRRVYGYDRAASQPATVAAVDVSSTEAA
jgi:hypothetical protein